jgi:hypothetical protein
MANGKMVVWIHGFNVPEVGGEAWGAEMFKRLYQAGSKAMFTAVHWAGDEFARLGGIAGAAEYYLAVERAILTAPVYAQEIEHLPGDSKVLISHSLGAGVVSEAIAHRGLTNFSRYIMIDGALPVEALDAQQAPDPIMIHPQWRDYPPKTQVSNWYQSFTTAQPQDARSHLRWRGQFQEMVATGKLSLMYSSGEEVLGNVPAQKADAFWFKVMGAFTPNEPFYSAGARYSWATSEWSKGRSGSWARLALSQWAGAGWGINPERMTIGVDPISQRVDLIPPTAADVAALTDKELRQKPVFAPFNLAKISGYEHDPSALDGPSGATVAADHRVRAKLLGCAIPAVTLAVGANGLKDANGNFIGDNYDMQAARNGWPSGTKYKDHQEWLTLPRFCDQPEKHIRADRVFP